MNYPLANDDERTSYRGEEDWKGKIVWMTPEKFLNLVAPLPDNLIDQKSVENLKHRFANNLPTDPLVLNVDMKTRKVTGHEGRHRAKVCIKMGIEKVPVLIYTGGGYTRVPKWTADQHRDVEDIDSFQKESVGFKEFFKLYLEASVLPNDTRSRTKSYSPDMQKPLKDSDTIRVYHGFNNINDLFQTLKSGVSGQERAKRIYSYEGNNNPKGLFVTIALSVAKQFGQYVMEIHAPVRELEAPVWPGNGYTVQGGMAEYFDGPEDRETQRMKDRDYSSKSKHDSIKNSDRPELAELLFNSSEQQALFVGNLNNNSIRAIWANPTPEKCGKFCTYTRMSVKEFLKNYKPSEEFKPKNPHRILKPRDIFDIHKFVDILVKQYSSKKYAMSKKDIINSLKGLNEHDWLTYIWPAQLPDALEQIKEV